MSPLNREESKKDDERTPDGKIKENEAENKRWKKVRVDGFVYRVLIVSPKSSERRRASRWTLPAAIVTVILAAAALVSIFGAPLHEATPVFRPFLAGKMPAVETPANSK